LKYFYNAGAGVDVGVGAGSGAGEPPPPLTVGTPPPEGGEEVVLSPPCGGGVPPPDGGGVVVVVGAGVGVEINAVGGGVLFCKNVCNSVSVTQVLLIHILSFAWKLPANTSPIPFVTSASHAPTFV